MRILITNDDGVHADGIKVLREVLGQDADVTVVAPLEERSTTAHTITLNYPLRVVEIAPKTWGCSGFPADCTFMALGHLVKETHFDLVVSGINRGANLGQDVYYSGTVAAAREAAFRKIPAIAISQVIDNLANDQSIYFYTAAVFLRQFIKSGGHKQIPPYGLLNVNVPNLPTEKVSGVKYTTLGFRHYSDDIEERIDCRNRPYYWIGGNYKGPEPLAGSDCMAVLQGEISLSLLNILQRQRFDMESMKSFVDGFRLSL